MNCNGGLSASFDNNLGSMDCTPLVTYAGDEELFNTLANNLVKSISTDSAEWRRSYDRPIKQVKLNARFIPFSQEVLPKEKDCQLVKKPIFHTYWSECSDVDVYKTFLRDDIDSWLKTSAKAGIQDWMIVLVETYDIKKSNKLLPRTTVLDKIRSDFASKHGDRCLSIINPIKSESRSAESWRGLITRIRHLMLTAYDRTLLKFEETIREHREKRNHTGWNFCHYFLLQEELAFVLEMLGLYDEALVQYDELDALFTQFVINSNVGDTPVWLSSFQSSLNKWSGVNLNNSLDYHTRILIAECKASLLDLRSYLFGRQCAMLLLLKKPWEMAQRCLTFVHDTMNELRILEVQRPEGSVECWAFLCALEVLHACQSSTSSIDNSQLDMCSSYTASLWALARDKLESLGKLCGLMPGNEPTSEQLHTVVYLIAGMGDSEPATNEPDKLTPTDKLKEALSSKEAFKKQYLYHAELAMGTFKHVNRIRSARMIGKELARFYSDMNENQKAVVFLLDALQTYSSEGWTHLAAQTQHELAQCYKKMDDVERYTKVCAAIAASEILHMTIRNSYLDEMLAYSKMINSPQPLLTELSSSFAVQDMEVNVTDKVIQDCEVRVEIVLLSRLPRPVTCRRAELSVEEVPKPNVKKKGAKTLESTVELLLKCKIDDMKPRDPCLQKLPATRSLIYKEDKSIGSAGVDIRKSTKTPVKRSDSVKHRKPSMNVKGDFAGALSTSEEFLLQPGINKFVLTKRVDQPGIYRVGQLSLVVENNIEFLSSVLEPRLCYSVAKTQPTITLNCSRDLLAGLAQSVELVISSGSVKISEGSSLKLRASRGMTVSKAEEIKDGRTVAATREIEVTIPSCEPFETSRLKLIMFAELPPKKDSSSIEHKLNFQCSWNAEESITLHFGTPLMSTMKLHTAKRRKFIQIVVTGLSSQLLQLTEPQLTSGTSVDVHFKSLNPTAGQKLVIGNGMFVSFMWEVEIGHDEERSTIPIKTDFKVKYIAIENLEDLDEIDGDKSNAEVVDDPLHIRDLEKVEKESNVYWCNFDVIDYSTLFTVSSRVDPISGGGEFCRAGSMCHLCLTVTRMQPISSSANHHHHHHHHHQHHHPPQLMYEVLADQTMWAVCGRTAGIVSLEVLEKQSVTLDVMPLTSGYLPLPVVRLSRYIPATVELKNDTARKNDIGTGAGPRLEPFSPGQVYNASKAQQVHVLPAAPLTNEIN